MDLDADRGLVWVLDLWAEHAFAEGDRTPPRRLIERAAREARKLGAPIGEGDVRLDDAGDVDLSGRAAAFWSPLPHSLERARRAGLRVPPAPSFDILRHWNHKHRVVELCEADDEPFGDVHAVAEAHELRELLARPPTAGDGWLVKRSFGAAGRGSLRLSAADLAGSRARWVDEWSHGWVVEPHVRRLVDVSAHGWVGLDGSVILGEPCVHETRDSRSFAGARRASEVPESGLQKGEVHRLLAKAEGVGQALSAGGYFGPFGIDGFAYARPDGRRGFRPLCDLNARLTLAWGIGLPDGRRHFVELAPTCAIVVE